MENKKSPELLAREFIGLRSTDRKPSPKLPAEIMLSIVLRP